MQSIVIDGVSYLVAYDDPNPPKSRWDLIHPTPERVAELRSMPYRDYLQTPEWRERRAMTIRYAEKHCERCHRKPFEFHVHHRTYERLGEEWSEDLEALCPECHRKEHGIAA